MNAAIIITILAVALGALSHSLRLPPIRHEDLSTRAEHDAVTSDLLGMIRPLYQSVLFDGLRLRPIGVPPIQRTSPDTNMVRSGGLPMAHHAYWYGMRKTVTGGSWHKSEWQIKTEQKRALARRTGRFW